MITAKTDNANDQFSLPSGANSILARTTATALWRRPEATSEGLLIFQPAAKRL